MPGAGCVCEGWALLLPRNLALLLPQNLVSIHEKKLES